MKQLTIFFTALVLTCFALAPAAARADELDDLEVTMEVFDNPADIPGEIAEMDGPDRDDIRAGEDHMEAEGSDEESGEDDTDSGVLFEQRPLGQRADAKSGKDAEDERADGQRQPQ